MKPAFALLDCNNFYASCETVFAPRLAHCPVVVLSNNDGCVIARSDESKALGIKMGQPFFEIKPLVKRHNITVLSANFALYGDMSARLSELLHQACEQVEIYSIDEAFLKLDGIFQPDNFAQKLVQQIKQYLGLPVSIGIGPTKTLAKLANQFSKQHKSFTKGVFDLSCPTMQAKILPLMPIESIWGVGRKWTEKLKKLGITDAYALSQVDLVWARKKFNVVLVQTIRELKGESCLSLSVSTSPNQQIIVSRSFNQLQTEYDALRSAIATHAASAAAKLRRQLACCEAIYVYAKTNPHRSQDKQYHGEQQLYFPIPTDDTTEIVSHAMLALRTLFRPDIQYKKAGVVLSGIVPNTMKQQTLLQEQSQIMREDLMAVLDNINLRYGKGTMRYGVEQVNTTWQGKREWVSPQYTTQWTDLPIVKAT